jgi:hypothetical protein
MRETIRQVLAPLDVQELEKSIIPMDRGRCLTPPDYKEHDHD